MTALSAWEDARQDVQKDRASICSRTGAASVRQASAFSLFFEEIQNALWRKSSEYFGFVVFSLFLFISFSITYTKFNCIYHMLAKTFHSSKFLWIILYCSQLFALSSAVLLSPLKCSYLLSLEKFHHCSWGYKLSASFWNHKLLLSYHWRNFHTASLFFSIGINFWYGILIISFTCILGTRKIISKSKSPGCSKIA